MQKYRRSGVPTDYERRAVLRFIGSPLSLRYRSGNPFSQSSQCAYVLRCLRQKHNGRKHER